MSAERIVPVGLGARAYDVVIGQGLIGAAGARLAALAPNRRIAVVSDENVAKRHLDALREGCEQNGLLVEAIVLPAGEQTKSFSYLEALLEQLLELGFDRKDLVVAFGGGVIGDLAGLAAGLLKRGVDYAQIPTTLLAQVDSSVGGKTAIDSKAGKNMIGLFHQPRLVLADLDALATLPTRELKAGLAEVLKYGLIDDAPFFAWCVSHAGDLLARDPEALAYAVERSVMAKARIVALDERESGPRALLNLGHTFGHALEALSGLDGCVLHGEAVAVGMAMAFRFSARSGLCSQEDAARVTEGLKAFDLPTFPRHLPTAPFDPAAALKAMMQDKKAEGGRLTLILAEGVGRAVIRKDADAAAVRAFLDEELPLQTT